MNGNERQDRLIGVNANKRFTQMRTEFRVHKVGHADYPGRGYIIERTLNLELLIFALHDSDYLAAELINRCADRIKLRSGIEDYLAALELALFTLQQGGTQNGKL
ncbi:MAG: hypothetical protein ACYCSN_13900 [Acidobacteriaceae bacterium]